VAWTDTRFENIKAERVYALATLLDPRYKGRLFAPDELEATKQWAIDEARFEPSHPPANSPQPPPAKKARAGPLDVLDAILGTPAPTSSASAASLVDAELSAYLQGDVIGRAESPTEWWAANAAKYPLLAAEAKRYLSAPPTSVASERVFSAAGRIYTDKRNRLLPKRADMLLFLKHNLPAVNYKY